MSNRDIFDRLMDTIIERKNAPSEKSYTNSLLSKGLDKICEKIREESNEVVDASHETDADALSHQIHEAADLIYHLWVLLCHLDISLEDVRQELERRFGTSGIEEKLSRASKPTSSDQT